MGLFAKFKAGLQKTHSKLAHEIKRIVTRSPKLDAATLEELEAALIAADLGMAMTHADRRRRQEGLRNAGQRRAGCVRHRAARKLRRALPSNRAGLAQSAERADGRLHRRRQRHGQDHHRRQARAPGAVAAARRRLLAACDTFRAAAIEQIKLWGQRLKVEVIAGAYGADAGVGGARRRGRRAGAQGGLPVR